MTNPDLSVLNPKDQKGIALIMVLWVMVLMAAMATEFSHSMRVEVTSTRNFKEELECDFLSESGIELALEEILGKADFQTVDEKGQLVFVRMKKKEGEKAKDVPGVITKEEEAGKEEAGKKEILKIPPRINIPLGAGTVSYHIADEGSKININSASEEIFSKILEESGVQDEELRATIAASILDWIDPNDLHRLNGAEEEYYQGLEEPYACKNKPFDTLEELLLVKGMTPEILFGTVYVKRHEIMGQEDVFLEDGEKLKGIYSLLTVQGSSSVNPNTASEGVLNILYPPDMVKKIIEKRDKAGKFDLSKSSYFTVYSLGEIKESEVRHLIVATFQLKQGAEGQSVSIAYWNDNEDPEKYDDLFN